MYNFKIKKIIAYDGTEIEPKAINIIVGPNNSGKSRLLKEIKAILCDERALQIYDTYYAIEPQRNAKGKFTNHFLSTEKIFSWSNLVNIAVFNIE